MPDLAWILLAGLGLLILAVISGSIILYRLRSN